MVWITYAVLIGLIFLLGIRIVRPTELGVIERLGKYTKTANQGFHWIIPIIDRMIKVNVTEQMVDVEPQTVITRDKLNVVVDAVVYYQIKDVVKSIYNVDNHKVQLTSLARTTLRAVIGKMTLTEANENRDEINTKVEAILDKETKSYGVEVLRVEIQTLEPPQDVQESMNQVVKAEQEKIAARDFANATETKADGDRRAEIKKAEGIKQALILESEGKAEAIIKVAAARANEIQVVNESINKYFKNEAQVYKKLETAAQSLERGSKYVIDSRSNIMNVISDVAGVAPLPVKKTPAKTNPPIKPKK
ncbi:MAG: SPFH domain-containing protein [archaeon]|nr:SPFH domain-containing protein [archaeon]